MRKGFFCGIILFLVGCAYVNKFVPSLVSIDEEDKIGKDFAREVENQSRIDQDEQVRVYLENLGNHLLQHVAEVNFKYTFKLVDDSAINAFALPGGHVYVNRGLMLAAANEAELASVMSHEIGHVIERHGTKRITTMYGYNFLLSLALGSSPNQFVALAANLFGQAGILAYSRVQETEADEVGVTTLYKAGYDPRAMVSFFKKLQEQSKGNPSVLEKYLSSHPLTEDRIKDISGIVSTLDLNKNFKLDTPEFIQAKARLR